MPEPHIGTGIRAAVKAFCILFLEKVWDVQAVKIKVAVSLHAVSKKYITASHTTFRVSEERMHEQR